MQAATSGITKGNAVIISIIDAAPEMNKQIFEGLSDGGNVIMQLSQPHGQQRRVWSFESFSR
ncbi:hypothetical protein P9F83_13010 [Peribacillus psychrosaccharolyticus]|uniref:hypothetical protein n=1 Tax=Peribacillus psychrosaccharolyticus TaxID=1407 RepID=UPI000590A7AB|nr:hypothetical protein [Peribacillus psychrosaccharolyticus]MEC2056142.1 hypothetical protein [Peribacillus psychrosaccharolyticus]